MHMNFSFGFLRLPLVNCCQLSFFLVGFEGKIRVLIILVMIIAYRFLVNHSKYLSKGIRKGI